MAELKTKENDASVTSFLNGVENKTRRTDSFTLLEIMHEITGESPKMWGESIIGFGTYHYVYASGREGDWMRVGFSPRKQALTLYLSYGFTGKEELISKLGKFKTGKGCLYLKKLEDVDLATLKELIQISFEEMVDQG